MNNDYGESVFPEAIDNRIYMQEVRLSQLSTKDEYDRLREAGRYGEAVETLKESDLNYFGAPVLNHIESRLVALEEYLPTLEKPVLSTYTNVEPNVAYMQLENGFSWVGPEDYVTELIVGIVWDDDDNIQRKRPNAVSVNVYQDGTRITTVTLNASNNWSYTMGQVSADSAYTVTCSDYTRYTKSIDGTIIKFTISSIEVVDIPVVTSPGAYTGATQDAVIESYDHTLIAATGTTSAIDAGDYNVTFSLTDPYSYIWNDGTSNSQIEGWSIEKAEGFVTLNVSTITFDNNTPQGTVTITSRSGEVSRIETLDSNRRVTTDFSAALNGEVITITNPDRTNGIYLIQLTIDGTDNYHPTITIPLSITFDYQPIPYVIKWTAPLSSYGSFINDSVMPGTSTTTKYGWKQILYYDVNDNLAFADPYQPGSITIQDGTGIYLETYAGQGTDNSTTTWYGTKNGSGMNIDAKNASVGKFHHSYIPFDTIDWDDNHTVILSKKIDTNNTTNNTFTWSVNIPADVTPVVQTVPVPTVTSNLTYNGSQQTARVSSYDSTIVAVTGITGTNAGNYTATFSLLDTDGYTWTDGTTTNKTQTWSIAKANGSVIAPTVKSLTYNGSAQTLINAGSSTTGTIQYKLNGGTYGTSLPTGTNAGSYTVYYRVVGDSNHNDVAEAALDASIARANGAITLSKDVVNLDASTTSDTVTFSGNTGIVTVSSSNTSVATASISGNAIVIRGVNNTSGNATITVNVAQYGNYNATSRTISVTASYNQTYTVYWTEPLCTYGSYINDIDPDSTTTSQYGWKQISYYDSTAQATVTINPYQAGSMVFNSIYSYFKFQMYAGQGYSESGVSSSSSILPRDEAMIGYNDRRASGKNGALLSCDLQLSQLNFDENNRVQIKFLYDLYSDHTSSGYDSYSWQPQFPGEWR